MTNADWWARVVEARTERQDLLPQRVWALRKGEHEATIDPKAVPGIGAEIVLTVDGEMRKTRLSRWHEQAALVGAIADTRALFEGKGWAYMRPTARASRYGGETTGNPLESGTRNPGRSGTYQSSHRP